MSAFLALTAAVLISIGIGLGTLDVAGQATTTGGISTLEANGIGTVHFGISKAQAVGELSALYGTATDSGVNTACGPRWTEVQWTDLVAEFYQNTFSGYRYDMGDYPPGYVPIVAASGAPLRTRAEPCHVARHHSWQHVR